MRTATPLTEYADAKTLVHLVRDVFDDLAIGEHSYDWADHDSCQAFVNHLRGGRAWVVGPREIKASVPDLPGNLWEHKAADVLDLATNRTGAPELPTTAQIGQVRPGIYRLTW